MAGDETRDLVDGVLQGEHRRIAEALACVEDRRPEALPTQRALLHGLSSEAPADHGIVGLTGPPGAGKSSLAAALIQRWTAAGRSVGMVAVDPSSRASGGALLGDRARLHFSPDDRVFVRSMATGEQLGGLAPATRAAALVLSAAFDWTLIETVGVGQSEIDIATVADSVVLVLQPGSGDTLQFMKAGILEVPDVLVVHKWDLGIVAARTLADLESILMASPAHEGSWAPPILGVSSRTGEGVEELGGTLDAHREHLDRSGERARRREESRVAWALELFTRRYGTRGLEQLGGQKAAAELCRAASGTALDAFSELATRAGLDA